MKKPEGRRRSFRAANRVELTRFDGRLLFFVERANGSTKKLPPAWRAAFAALNGVG
jgi:hypothetical protein